MRSLRLWQTLAGLATTAALILAAYERWWPFDAQPRIMKSYAKPSVWQLLLSDRLTLGFLRAGLIGLMVYIVVSVVALFLGGRWLRAFGTSGLTADDAQSAKQVVADLNAKLEDVTAKLNEAANQADTLIRERNVLRNVLRTVVRDARQTSTTTVSSPIVREPEREADERRPTAEDQGDPGGS
jgi:hypothetical protein